MRIIAKTYLVLAWAFFIFQLLTAPLPESTGVESFGIDKIIHVFLFGVFAYLLAGSINNTAETPGADSLYRGSIVRLSAPVIISFLYAVSLEFIQIYIPGRYPASWDLIAGGLGAIAGVGLYAWISRSKKPKLLLHVCCIACGAYATAELARDYRVALYFYNPNIYPRAEHERRLADAKRVAKQYRLPIVVETYDHESWLDRVRGLEQEPERGERCRLCYRRRLEKTAAESKKRGMAVFATTLTVSPHKDAAAIMAIGEELAKKYGIEFISRDFKKQDGGKNASALSRSLGLYRQDYCGCEFSMRRSR